MGKPQGDDLPDAAIYEREIDGETYQRPAYVPEDHVNLRARAWTMVSGEVPEAVASGAVAAVEEPAEKRAGSHKRATAQVVPSHPGAADAGGQGNA